MPLDYTFDSHEKKLQMIRYIFCERGEQLSTLHSLVTALALISSFVLCETTSYRKKLYFRLIGLVDRLVLDFYRIIHKVQYRNSHI